MEKPQDSENQLVGLQIDRSLSKIRVAHRMSSIEEDLEREMASVLDRVANSGWQGDISEQLFNQEQMREIIDFVRSVKNPPWKLEYAIAGISSLHNADIQSRFEQNCLRTGKDYDQSIVSNVISHLVDDINYWLQHPNLNRFPKGLMMGIFFTDLKGNIIPSPSLDRPDSAVTPAVFEALGMPLAPCTPDLRKHLSNSPIVKAMEDYSLTGGLGDSSFDLPSQFDPEGNFVILAKGALRENARIDWSYRLHNRQSLSKLALDRFTSRLTELVTGGKTLPPKQSLKDIFETTEYANPRFTSAVRLSR